MARCSCSGDQCNCVIVAGPGAEVSGAGHPTNPYVISSTGLIGALAVRDTDTVDMAIDGLGQEGNPFVVSATATVRLTDLVDRDPAVNPQVGYVPVWGGTSWAFGAPPVAPAGAVNTTGGVTGNGGIDTPIRAATSGTWGSGPLNGFGSDSTIGTVIYVDTNGQLRASPQPALPTQWTQIVGRPTFFPTNWDNIAGKPTRFPTSWTMIDGRPMIVHGRVNVPELAPQTEWFAQVTLPAGVFGVRPSFHTTNGNAYVGVGAVFLTDSVVQIGLSNTNNFTSPASVVMWTAIQPSSTP